MHTVFFLVMGMSSSLLSTGEAAAAYKSGQGLREEVSGVAGRRSVGRSEEVSGVARGGQRGGGRRSVGWREEVSGVQGGGQ